MVELSLTLGCLAISIALVESNGPFGVLSWLRSKTVRFGLLDCLVCVSMYASVALVWAFKSELGLLGGLGIWGVCVVFDKVLSAYITRG